MTSEKQKNENILNRFETKEIGTKMKAYRVKVRGAYILMLCPNGESIEEAEKEARLKFQRNFGGISEG